MSILSTFKKYKDYILTENGYQLSSRWTKSDAVVMGDGTDDTNTLESNLGAIKGITSDLACEDTNVAASMSAVGAAITELNNNLKFPDGTGFYPDTKDGVNGYNTSEERGADTFHPFSNNKADLLWTNPNPASGFGAVTVSLDLSSYDGVLIQSSVNIYTGSGVHEPNTFSFVNKGKTARIFGAQQATRLKDEITTRLATVSDTGVTFTSGYFPNSGVTDGGFCVPKYIYGVKISF